VNTDIFSFVCFRACRYSFVFQFDVPDEVAVALAMKAGLSEEKAQKNVAASLCQQMLEGEMGARVERMFDGYGLSWGEVIGWDHKSQKYMIEWMDGSKAKKYWLTYEELCEYKVTN
jgi:hypothetical protein